MLGPKKCAIVISNTTKSAFLDVDGESWTYSYNVQSQNPAIELRMGQKTAQIAFNALRVLDLNSEQMATVCQRHTIKNVNEFQFRNALSFAGLPDFDNGNTQTNNRILDEIKNKYIEDAVDVMIFKIDSSNCPLWIRRPIDHKNGKVVVKEDVGESRLGGLLADHLNTISYVTVVRPALEEGRRFVDHFWDYQIDKCKKEGIYWGYNLHRPLKDNMGSELSYTTEVLEGRLPAPCLSWFRLPKKPELLSHPYRPFMTSMKEWEALVTIGLLHEIQHQRLWYKAIYSFEEGPEHKVEIWIDPQDATRLCFYVYAGHAPGVEKPKVPVDTQFKLQYNGLELDGGVAIKLPENAVADLVLEFTLDEGAKLPWQMETGDELQVKLDMTFNVEAASRSLAAIQFLAKHASDADKKMLLSRPLEQAQQSATLKSLKAKFHAANYPLWHAIETWEGKLRLNQLQHRAIESCLEFLVTYIQGPPGTGKSEVAVDAAVLVASLGENVVIASPTNGAGKSNASKLASTMRTLPSAMAQRFHPVYLPTQKESIERMYEHQGYAARSDQQDSDNVFNHFQLWSRVVEFAGTKILDTQKLEVAERFLTAFERLKTAPSEVSELELNEFRKNFKTISDIYLRREDISFIFITTCNNSAMLSKLDVKCGLLLLDEAALATQYDFAVPLQIQHSAVAQLGDHLQVDPPVMSKDHNPAYDLMKVSNFERNVTNGTVVSTMLRIVYRFGETIADTVGTFGGYGGLASGANEESEFYSSFKSFMLASPDYKVIMHPRHSQYVAKQKDAKLKNNFHRICLNVKNGHSSLPHSGSSTVNYANVDAILTFVERCMQKDGIEASDIGIGTPFVSQAQLFREQLRIRGLAGIDVFTIGVSQGSEKKLWISCFTVANTTEPAYIGAFLTNWLRINVLISRAEAALVMAFNFDLMRPYLPSFYEQNPTWAHFLIDQLDSGPMINVEGSKVLPKDTNEWNRGKQYWSLVQHPSDNRTLHSTFKKKPQDDFKLGPTGLYFMGEADGRQKFSSREGKEYLRQLKEKRERARVVIAEVHESEKKWQEEREIRNQRLLVDLAVLNEVAPVDALMEDVV